MQRNYIYCFLLLLLFFSNKLEGQTYVDTLQQKSYDELIDIFARYQKTDSVKTKQIAKSYLAKAKREKKPLRMARGFYLLYIVDNDIIYLDSIIDVTKNKQDLHYPAYAYFSKAQFFLYQERNIEKTLNNLNAARKYAKENDNTNLLYRIDYHIGAIKSEHLNEKEEAMAIFKECEKFYAKEIEYSHQYRYLNTLHAIAETYIGLEKNDSATYYNNLGYKTAFKNKDTAISKMKAYFILCEGINQYTRKEYGASIDSINKALPTMYGSKTNAIDSYFYLGKSYYDLNNKEKAIRYFIKTDSILETLNSIPQYKHVKTYEYLKDYYKDKNDLPNQNKYLNKLNSVLDNYLNDQISISKKVKEDYDIPLLLEEQQVVIKELNKSKSTYLSSIWILVLLLLILGVLLYYQYRKKQAYRLRFENLIQDLKTSTKNNQTNKKLSIDKTKTQDIPEKHVNYILEKLNEFEKERGYLTLGISSHSLAQEMETNVKYLSKVINHYKNKTFTNYVNELRIDYALKELQENVLLRKFTIKAIANEFGYNSAETFSKAFYKQVQIKPSYYIKQLAKVESDI
ncbi:helix-turn-helix domain-containing protein [Aquimarina gracilis]|uniref:Helix-turn-helix domain-containing protein n=1 Tax=Aquimarina gracilis TaxID=874422 RepID=A0ABU6A1S3_9FLAO|nr:helix-turn-helix domain-containing protein [Aquimarina gracilis]MEB3348018.1 helix-turn-helix domain-containing protein [Aquimarina gracilis]